MKKQEYILPHLFRLEYSKMTAVLCRHFGLKHIEIAEDIASDTFLKASETWALHGVPNNPTAWLYAVAKNKAKDYFKRRHVFETQIKDAVKAETPWEEKPIEFNERLISDSQLAMIFAVCNPGNAVEAQICLALQVLCGFSVEEIANAFLAKPETIKKRLHRARIKLRNDKFQINILSKKEIESRLHTVLKALYLLFNEGYFSKTHDRLIRKDLCSEALRLALILTKNPTTNTAEANALLSLMCFQSSRLEARTNPSGEAILFEQQDRNLWNRELIDRGNYYLIEACSGSANCQTKYHLEAGIAYWHTTSGDSAKWEHILQLYNQLVLIEYSPVTALNRAFVIAKVYGNRRAIKETENLNLSGNSFYHALLGHLYAETDARKAIAHYHEAVALTKSVAEKKTLMKEIERLGRTSASC